MSATTPVAVVADASSLIGLARIERLDLLRQLFRRLLIPGALEKELCIDSSRPGSQALADAGKAGWLTVERVEGVAPHLLATVDRGEAEAITLAKRESALLLIDESRGRIAASREGVRIFGTGAVLIKAKEGHFIPNVADPLDALSKVGYHLSAGLQKEILRLAGK